MNSRVSWSAESIDPSVREKAAAAARRAGMSLNDWLNSTSTDSAPAGFRPPSERPSIPQPEVSDVADIHARLDSITRQIEQISQQAPRRDPPRGETARNEYGVARQLNEAISRLDARLAKTSRPDTARPAQAEPPWRSAERDETVDPMAPRTHPALPPLSPLSLDNAVAEIEARQTELDHAAVPPAPRRSSPARPSPSHAASPATAPASAVATAPATPAGPDFSILERHLAQIASQIEALQRPDWIEQSIAGFRAELADIRDTIQEAMPRRAIESIENEIRALSRRIDDSRQSGIGGQALAGIERALGEIHEVLRSLTTAEQLAGYEEAIRNLGGKLDLILRASDDPSTFEQLEGAIAALRGIVSNVASNDMLARLNDDVRTLAAKIDQFSQQGGHTDSFAMLEHRIAALTQALENRERPAPNDHSEHLEAAVRGLSERLDRMPVGNDNSSAFVHLEQRVSYLLERLEASSDQGAGYLGRVEHGLQDVLRHLESQHAALIASAEQSRRAAQPADHGLIDMVKRGLSDIRFNQSETDRHTQDALETLHNTLGHVVDRLATIEGDLRAARAPLPAPRPIAAPAVAAPPISEYGPPPARQPNPAPRVAMAAQLKPELPNPAAASEQFAASPREFHAAAPPTPIGPTPAARGITEILESTAEARPAAGYPLPPNHPLEPGTRPSPRLASPSERIAASENAISEIANGAREPSNAASFIAAARRAAKAAAAVTTTGNPSAPRAALKEVEQDNGKKPTTIASKIRSLLVGASVVIIVLSAFKLAMTLLDSGNPSSQHALDTSSEPAASAPATPDDGVRPKMPTATAPSMTSPTPIGRQSLNSAPASAFDSPISAANSQTTAGSPTTAGSVSDNTGSIAQVQTAPSFRQLSWVPVPPAEKLPDAIGGPVLRTAALKGDPTAAYEIGVRFAEAKGVAQNFDEAAKWYERAAQAGVVPAMFRLGTLYEKGLSVRKDLDLARRYYAQAAERGNAKAMHNLAVLAADGGGNGPDYRTASQWFRKAAERGVADSQFNLGILYARGIGVEQNLAESFKWFSLAAAQGDADSARKRDDIARRLDGQSLAAAKLAIQTFAPEPQPDDAINVAVPAGGWEGAAEPSVTAKPPGKPASLKRTATAH
jgi:localization factor PodJL